MAVNLLHDSDEWGRRSFRLVAHRDGRNWWANPPYKRIIEQLVTIPRWDKFVAAQPDVMPECDRLDLEDNDSVRAFEVVRGLRILALVVKVVREARVPSVFHEAHVAHLLRERSISAPSVVGVVEGCAPGVRSYMIMFREQRSRALSELHLRLRPSDGRDGSGAEAEGIARAFGRAVSRLIKSGIVHEELDLKNVRVSTGRLRRFVFLDFERTRLFFDEPNEDAVAAWLGNAISRRVFRHRFDNALVEAFISGYLNGTQLTIRHIVRLVERFRAVAGDRVMVVAIDGFAGSGKSFVAQELRAHIKRCVVMETDSFMRFSRRERAETSRRLNDHRGWYDTSKLREVLLQVLSGAFRLKVGGLYSHESGEVNSTLTLDIVPGMVIIVEGMYAMSDEMIGLCDLTILLHARRDVLLQRVTRRDSVARKIPVSAIGARFSIINGPQYRRWFKSCTRRADLWLDTSSCDGALEVLGGSARVLRVFVIDI